MQKLEWLKKDFLIKTKCKKETLLASGNGTRNVCTGKNIETLPGCGEMGLGKVRHSWNWIWKGIWRIMRAFTKYTVQKMGVKEKVPPFVNKTGELVTGNMQNIKALNKFFFPQFSIVIHLPTLLQSLKIKTGTGGVKLLPSQEKVRFEMDMNMHKPVAPDQVHPGLQRGWWLPNHSPWHLTSHDRQVMSLMTGERKMMHPLLKGVERRSLGTTDLSDLNLHIFWISP